MDERKLVEQARDGNREAFRQLVERHQKDVFYLALGLLQNRDDAEDVVQEVFVKAYKALARFRGESGLGTWLFRICTNVCRDHQRRARFLILQRSLTWSSDEDQRWTEERADADPERGLASSRLGRDIQRAIARLTPAERGVFVLRHCNQLSTRDTAKVLGRAEGTVKNLLFRALRKLKNELAGYRPAEEAR